jgi:hypothetical protein
MKISESRAIRAAWEVDHMGLIRLDGIVVFETGSGLEVIVKDRDRRRSSKRGSQYVSGSLPELIEVLSRGGGHSLY